MALIHGKSRQNQNVHSGIKLVDVPLNHIPELDDPILERPVSEPSDDSSERRLKDNLKVACAAALASVLCDDSEDELSEGERGAPRGERHHETREEQKGEETNTGAKHEIATPSSHTDRLNQLRTQCNGTEKILLDRVVDLTNVPGGYSDVCVDEEVIKSLQRMTHLGVTRREQFEFGILKTNRIGGALLYGPPGTGKTVLAQAVAKECKFSMLAITSGDIFQPKWGDDEKMIRAAFSLSRKLHPCIMFIDEADGIFGARQTNDRRHVRGMISEFLSEWDGASGPKGKQNPLVLLATNRPFDIDQAILRRTPLRICIDIPTPQIRERILDVILRDETLEDITIQEIAKLTRLYTGSDLRGLCYSAALHCVDEQQPDKDTGKYIASRTLHRRHFKAALKEIRATPPNRVLARQLLDFRKRLG
ncbi:P-loop containing nucleoside triphosphate hydrolase protein [Nemania sp. FL0916]|nr:P-loop containing nucleoside triphosphate hydrolase protein [Nemania sp. FL0916]